MKVLIICPTYGRLPFLGRVLASFLDQDYVDKELLFINDDKNVRLTCNIENVHVINLNKKITLGSKRNIGVSFGHYDLYMHYDDDDVFLPGRISNHVQKHIDNPDIFFYWNSAAYFLSDREFSLQSCSSSACSIKRTGWVECGGYSDITKGEDVDFYSRVKNKLVDREINTVNYVYCWGGLNYHATYSEEKDMINEADKINKQYSINSQYEIIPDWDGYCKFVELSEIYQKTKTSINISHKKLGVIDY
jgi:glycosyltransferase involved in cell wall biosynthesis